MEVLTIRVRWDNDLVNHARKKSITKVINLVEMYGMTKNNVKNYVDLC